jgi:hypothetical protein
MNTQKLQLMMYDPSGRLVWSDEKLNLQGKYSKSVDLNSFPKGMFILKAVVDDQVISRKIMHQ